MVNNKVLLVVGLMAMAGTVSAAGFRLAEQDSRANGMGNAAVAVVDNPSAVWYNPAAMTGLEGTNLSLGTVMVAPYMEHTNASGTMDRIKNKVHIPPHLYAVRKLNNKFSLGLGVNAPFGLSTEWEKTAYTSAVATKSEVKAVNYNLNGAYKATEKLSVAAGISYAQVDATLNRMANAVTFVGLEGDGHGTGYNAAVMYKHSDKWNFGVNYRSKIKADLEGDQTVATTVTPVKTSLTLPDMAQFGAAYKHSANWLFTAEADYTNWTTYRSIIIENASTGAITLNDMKNWKSVWAFRVGAENKISDAWKFRVGAFYDMNPVGEKHFETRVPDTDRLAFSVGTGYTRNSVTVDASLMYLKFLERRITNSFGGDNTSSSATDQKMNGKYNSIALLPAITVSYKF
jgi:long-chain fatty acid transport protein